jgi:hypothetical protein
MIELSITIATSNGNSFRRDHHPDPSRTDADEALRITRGMYGEHAVVIRDDEDDDLRLRAEDVLERIGLDRTS